MITPTLVISIVTAVVVLLLCVFYKHTARLFGVVVVPENRVGHIVKKFALGKNTKLPSGRIIATQGEAGFQAKTLAPGIYGGFWPWQFDITLEPPVIVPTGKIALLNAKDGKDLPIGHILARRVDSDSYQDAEKFLNNNGQKGKQIDYLPGGLYRINRFLFDVVLTDPINIEDDEIGVITALDGEPLAPGHIAGKDLSDNAHNNFQDFEAFLKAGGNRGLQQQVILAGSYYLNPWAVTVEKVQMTVVPIGHVGVVISYVGEEGADVTGDSFKHGNLVERGKKGVWVDTFGPGKYPLNPHIMKVELVATTNIVLNWATGKNESHQLDKNLCTITVRSKDGFPFNLDVSQIIHIPAAEAPKVIARFGSMVNLVSQVLEPTIGNYFRNTAQDSDVIAFLSTRKERQDAAKAKITEVLNEYNVHAVDTLIGDINPPASLMATLTDRKIADEQVATYKAQMIAQQTRQTLKKEEALAEIQPELVKADQSVIIAGKTADAAVKKSEGEGKSITIKANAEADAKKVTASAEAFATKVTGEAEGERILSLGKNTAESYNLAVNAMGEDNFTKLKVIESIGASGINLMPKVLIMGGQGEGGNGSMNALLGFKVLESMGETITAPKKEQVIQLTEKTTNPEKKG